MNTTNRPVEPEGSMEQRFDKLFPKSASNNYNLWGTRKEYLAFIHQEIKKAYIEGTDDAHKLAEEYIKKAKKHTKPCICEVCLEAWSEIKKKAKEEEREKYEHLIRSVPIGKMIFTPVGGFSTITYTPSIEIEAWKKSALKSLTK